MANATCSFTRKGYTYEFFNHRILFGEARRNCTELGGDLATNLNASIVQNFKDNCGNIDRFYWIGLQRDQTCDDDNSNTNLRWINNGACINSGKTLQQKLLKPNKRCPRAGIALDLSRDDNNSNRADCRYSYICQLAEEPVTNDLSPTIVPIEDVNDGIPASTHLTASSSPPSSTVFSTQSISPPLSSGEIAAVGAGVGALALLLLMCYVARYFCGKCKMAKSKRLRLDSKFVLLNKEALQEHMQQNFNKFSARENCDQATSLAVQAVHSNLSNSKQSLHFLLNIEEEKAKPEKENTPSVYENLSEDGTDEERQDGEQEPKPEEHKTLSVYENLSDDEADEKKRESDYENLSDTDSQNNEKKPTYINLSNHDNCRNTCECAYETLPEATNTTSATGDRKSDFYENLSSNQEAVDDKNKYENISGSKEYFELYDPGEQVHIPSVEAYATKDFRTYVNASEDDSIYLEPNIYDSNITSGEK